jgi:uncharacterized membrane protein YbhN (UPF0104 family)
MPHLQFNTIWTILGILSLVFLHFVSEPIRWVVYLKCKDKISILTLCYIFFSTAFFSYILPAKLGIPLRFWLIKRYQKISSGVAGIFMITDGALGVVAWMLASLILGGNFTIAIIRQNLNRFNMGIELLILVLVALGIGLLILVLICNRKKKVFTRVLGSLRCLKLWQFLIIVIFFVADISTYIIRHSLIIALVGGPDLSWLSISMITVLSVFAGFVSAMPMGLVGYDATIIFLLTQQGMSLEFAAIVPIVNRSANLIASIIIGIPSSFYLGLGFNINEIKNKVNLSSNV